MNEITITLTEQEYDVVRSCVLVRKNRAQREYDNGQTAGMALNRLKGILAKIPVREEVDA